MQLYFLPTSCAWGEKSTGEDPFNHSTLFLFYLRFYAFLSFISHSIEFNLGPVYYKTLIPAFLLS